MWREEGRKIVFSNFYNKLDRSNIIKILLKLYIRSIRSHLNYPSDSRDRFFNSLFSIRTSEITDYRSS